MRKYKFTGFTLPKGTLKIVEEEGFWETDEYSPFFLEINFIDSDTDEGNFLFSFQFSPTPSEFDRWNSTLSLKGFEQSGYGWTEFLIKEIHKYAPEIYKHLLFDPEAETCYIATTSMDIFQLLLPCLGEIFKSIDNMVHEQ